jgi:hypothetical protein
MASKAARYELDDVPADIRAKRKGPSDFVDLAVTTPKYKQYRLHGSMYAYGVHWIDAKKTDGTMTRFSQPCLAFDPATGRKDTTKECPWCKHEVMHPKPSDREGSPVKGFWVSSNIEYFINALDISLLKKAIAEGPSDPSSKEKKLGYKLKSSDTPTPWVVLQFTAAQVRKVQGLRDLNMHEVNGETSAYAVSNPKYGATVNIKKDPTARAQGDKFQAAVGEHMPMKKSYLWNADSGTGWLTWSLEDLYEMPSLGVSTADYISWAERHKLDSVYATTKTKKSSKVMDDDDETTGLEEEEEAAPPKKPKKPVAKRSADEDEDEGGVEDYGDSDADEEDPPPPPKKAKKPVAKKPVDDDEPTDDDDGFDDEEDPPPPPKKAKKPVAKKPVAKKPVDDDEPTDDDDDIPY